MMRATLLGSGSSAGVPEIGCGCRVCQSSEPRNKRTRASLLIEIEGKNILIDTSPDLRQQSLRHGLRRVDAVLYTHDHADHTGGLDDLRAFNALGDAAISVYGNAATLDILEQRYAYAFLPRPERAWFRPCVVPEVLPDEEDFTFEVLGVTIRAFQQVHGRIKTFGYRIGNFAYSTDTDALPEAAFRALEGVDTWIVDCLRYSESYTHSNLARTLGWIERVGPRMAILTHMAHDFDYVTLSNELPAGVVPGYDGIVCRIMTNPIKTFMRLLVFYGAAVVNPIIAHAQTGTPSGSAYDFSFETLEGEPMPLSQFKGKALLVVNTASKCGFTPQYEGLEALYNKYKDRGLVVVGVPSNDFGGQEPGSAGQIREFCKLHYGVSFPMASKQVVVGDAAHPFYKWISEQLGFGAAPKWNFHKYLIDTHGRPVDFYLSTVAPDSDKLQRAIEDQLPKDTDTP